MVAEIVAAADKPLERARCTPEEKKGSINATPQETIGQYFLVLDNVW